jgi:hypothetical protein
MKKRSAPNGYSARAAAALGALTLSLGVGFGCDDAGRAPSSPDAGDAGVGGSGGTGGAGSGGRPPIPPATFESCSPLAFTFNGSDCSSACSSVRCECDPFPSSYLACHPERGCLTGMDCSVACERDLGDVLECVDRYEPCDSDADCSSGRCLRGEASGRGDCSPGTPGASCLDDGDCLDEACVAV